MKLNFKIIFVVLLLLASGFFIWSINRFLTVRSLRQKTPAQPISTLNADLPRNVVDDIRLSINDDKDETGSIKISDLYTSFDPADHIYGTVRLRMVGYNKGEECTITLINQQTDGKMEIARVPIEKLGETIIPFEVTPPESGFAKGAYTLTVVLTSQESSAIVVTVK
jgi:hypothetical protein